MIEQAAIGEPGTAAEMLRNGAGDIVAAWRAACTPEALGHGAGATEESDELTADRARSVVTATGPSVVAALVTFLDAGGQEPSAEWCMAGVADELGDNGFGVGPLVRQLSLLRQVLHGEARRRVPASALAETEHQLDVALDALMEACAARAAERLEQDAFVDPLTGLLNRRALERDLSREMAAAERHGHPLSVLTADLDGLKKINDRDGHSMGDEALKGVAAALSAALRESDSAYRVGGDEFVVLLPDMGSEAVSSFVGRVRAAGPPSFSWGAATFPDEVTNRPSLLDLADRRLLGYRQAEGLGRPKTADEVARAGSAGSSSGLPVRRSRRSVVVAAFLGGVLLGGGSLASAATGTLPGQMQEVAHSMLAKVGVPVPEGKTEDRAAAGQGSDRPERFREDAAGVPCTYLDGRAFTGTHGQYVASHPDDASTPENERALAAQSLCGRPAISQAAPASPATPGTPAAPGKSGEAGRPDGAGTPSDTGRPTDPGPVDPAQGGNPAQPVAEPGNVPPGAGRPERVDGPTPQGSPTSPQDKPKETVASTPAPMTTAGPTASTTTTTTTTRPGNRGGNRPPPSP